jgi:DNA-binding transcriptional ArsR family regulator
MLRIHFSAEDLARTRVAATWGPWAETVLCFGELRHPNPSAPFRPWRHATRGAIDARPVELARYLRPLPGTVVDLLTLVGEVDSFDTGAEMLAARSDVDLRTELGPFRPSPLPPWLAGLEQAEPQARQLLTLVLRRTHQRLIAPHWPSILSHLIGEQARMGRLLTDHGLEHLLDHLHPGIRWRPPTLEIIAGAPWASQPGKMICTEIDVHLRGRGLVVVPSVFCGRVPIPLFPLDGDAALLLVPAPPELADAAAMWNGGSATSDPLAAVLGRTRAAVLRSLDGAMTTTELAQRLHISTGGASQHASALRAAGLVTSRRDRNRMVHTATDVGAELLHRTG